MDYPPNFSLGITQLDAKEKGKDIPVGSVPSKFDEEDPNFAENCSKHRNDPVTMKKLKKVATSGLKKSGSKAATKRKFDDSGRPRLPKCPKEQHTDGQSERVIQTLEGYVESSCY
ncbi:hypothetical protein P3S67_016204 [Capsicum chacoense]